MSFDSGLFGSGLGGILGGIFGHSQKPYDKAMDQYKKYGELAQKQQQPWMQAGQSAIPKYQSWLDTQQDPSAFVNNLMNDYQESPYANYLQQQAMRAGTNAASESGLIGSSPFLQQSQQNAHNIASQDLNQWLQNVLGINTQYGQGQNQLIQGGQNAANSLSTLYKSLSNQLGEQEYNKYASRNNDTGNILGGIGSMIGSFF